MLDAFLCRASPWMYYTSWFELHRSQGKCLPAPSVVCHIIAVSAIMGGARYDNSCFEVKVLYFKQLYVHYTKILYRKYFVFHIYMPSSTILLYLVVCVCVLYNLIVTIRSYCQNLMSHVECY